MANVRIFRFESDKTIIDLRLDESASRKADGTFQPTASTDHASETLAAKIVEKGSGRGIHGLFYTAASKGKFVSEMERYGLPDPANLNIDHYAQAYDTLFTQGATREQLQQLTKIERFCSQRGIRLADATQLMRMYMEKAKGPEAKPELRALLTDADARLIHFQTICGILSYTQGPKALKNMPLADPEENRIKNDFIATVTRVMEEGRLKTTLLPEKRAKEEQSAALYSLDTLYLKKGFDLSSTENRVILRHELFHLYQDERKTPLSISKAEKEPYLTSGPQILWELNVDKNTTPTQLMARFEREMGITLPPRSTMTAGMLGNKMQFAAVWMAYDALSNRPPDQALRKRFDDWLSWSNIVLNIYLEREINGQPLLERWHRVAPAVLTMVHDEFDAVLPDSAKNLLKIATEREKELNALKASLEKTLQIIISSTQGLENARKIDALTSRYVVLALQELGWRQIRKQLQSNPSVLSDREFRLQLERSEILASLQWLILQRPFDYIGGHSSLTDGVH